MTTHTLTLTLEIRDGADPDDALAAVAHLAATGCTRDARIGATVTAWNDTPID